jgi:hypothetical protein
MIITLDILENWDFNNLLPVKVRTKECYARYIDFKNNLAKNNYKLTNYLIDKYLNNRNYNFVPNEFPYNVPNNMAHYVLWINPNYVDKLTNIEIVNIINEQMVILGYQEYICFENDIKTKSVLDILHYQVFLKKC